MTARKRVASTIVALTVGIGALTAGYLVAQPRAIDVCVQVWEDASGSGDTWTKCDTPSTLKVPNLEAVTTGLNGGCNRGINQSSSWTDCISSVRVTNLPANYRVRLYQNTNYGSWVWCTDINGNTPVSNLSGGANDVTSSFRAEGGNC